MLSPTLRGGLEIRSRAEKSDKSDGDVENPEGFT